MNTSELLKKQSLLLQQLKIERDNAITRAETAETALAQCQHDLGTMTNRVEQADAALASANELLELEQWQARWRQRAQTAEAALERSAGAGLELRAELADVYRRAEQAEAALAQCHQKTANLEWQLAQSRELSAAARAEYNAEFAARLAATAALAQCKAELRAAKVAP